MKRITSDTDCLATVDVINSSLEQRSILTIALPDDYNDHYY